MGLRIARRVPYGQSGGSPLGSAIARLVDVARQGSPVWFCI